MLNRKNCPSTHDTFSRLAADRKEDPHKVQAKERKKHIPSTTKATKQSKLTKYATIYYGIQIDSYSGETQELHILFPQSLFPATTGLGFVFLWAAKT